MRVEWSHGGENLIDISGLAGSFRVFAPLRDTPGLFAEVKTGDQGTDVVWNNEIDIANDMLWRLAQEQSGAAMTTQALTAQPLTAQAFQDWRKRRALTLETAARSLGISRWMLAYYDQGKKPIPRVVALATRALEMN